MSLRSSARPVVSGIRRLPDAPEQGTTSVLVRRLADIDVQIARVREHRRGILTLMRSGRVEGRTDMMTKDKWVTIMQAAGLDEAAMHRWHVEFERAAPDEHEEFLRYLHIPGDEIRSIRDWSRSDGGR